MEREAQFINNPFIEASNRINMSYLLLNNPKMIETMQKTGSSFFHGTNANALPSILKYGINSVSKSQADGIELTTGEEWSRIQGKRNFVSVTDSLEVALNYAGLIPSNKDAQNSLLNFGVVIGISLQDMKKIQTTSIHSDMPEIGIIENLPLENIKFLSVPKDKKEFVKKLVGEKNIEVIDMDIYDKFYHLDYIKMLEYLEHPSIESENTNSRIFTKQEIKNTSNTRKLSCISRIYNKLFNKYNRQTKERG